MCTTHQDEHDDAYDRILDEFFSRDPTHWLDYDFAKHSVLELFALGYHFLLQQLGSWLWATQPGHLHGYCACVEDYMEIDDWMLVVAKLGEALGAKLEAELGKPVDGLTVLVEHYRDTFDTWQEQVNLLCAGRFDLLHEAFGWYTEEQVPELMTGNYRPTNVYYLGGVFRLPKGAHREAVKQEEVESEKRTLRRSAMQIPRDAQQSQYGPPRAERPDNKPEGPRVCGDCKLCCKVYPLPLFNKPRKVWCQHAARGGCSIYDERPDICRDFTCVWLNSNLPDKYRPDKCGVVVRYAGELDGQRVCAVSESYDGAWLRKSAQELVSILIRSDVVCVIAAGDQCHVRWDVERHPDLDQERVLRVTVPSGADAERAKAIGAIEDIPHAGTET